MHLKNVRFHPDLYPTREHYPFNLEIFRETTELDLNTAVTFFVGENGAGKSTLLEAIARRAGIHIWREGERTRCVVNIYEDKFYRGISIEWVDDMVPGSFFGSSVFQDFARLLDEWAAADPGQLDYFGGKSLLTQSHGQAIMSFFKARYAIKGLYLLDEPETALSPKTQIALLELLTKLSQAGHAQFLIATHSPILLSCPGAMIYSFDHSPITSVPYQDTEHYRVYRAFMEDQSRREPPDAS
ncbi:MAG TPA: AAA family ATPase [Sedimentisphaerales bacterium]|jgi:predicted ATPase|nr:AAA family ATPase [Sedimentisphaerales bacterium]HNU29404.1 AAA family ATPase [Sedimentisphaerales bacterium]